MAQQILINSIASGMRRRAPWAAALVCLGLSAEAHAQELAPIVAPLPPASAPEPPASPPVSAPPPPLAWAGTTFEWGNQISTKIFGLGSDYVGTEDERAVMTFSLHPSYFLLWRPRHQLSVSARVTLFVELTDSNVTALKRAPQFADIPLGVDYAATLFTHGHGPSLGGVQTMQDPTLLGEGDYRTWALASAHLVLPTSLEARAAGVDLATSVSVGVRQQVKLLGGESSWLSYLLVTASERWTHAFTRELRPNGVTVQSGIYQPSIVYPLLPDTLSHTLALTLPIHRRLQLDSTLQLRTGIPSSPGSGGNECIPTATGCVPRLPVTPPSTRWSTRFVLGLSCEIIPELGVALGYANDAARLGENGLKRSLFFSPEAQLYTSVSFSFDRLYQRLRAPDPASAAPPR